MKTVEIAIDPEEHDLARDEALQALGEIEDDGVRLAHAHGMMTAAIIAMSPTATLCSILGLLDHMKECAKDYAEALDGAQQ